jgi:alpha-beta hydrolase superfamily lysophospholipase
MRSLSLLAVVAIAGCGAHELDPGLRMSTPAPPVVAGATFGSERFVGVGGVLLYGRWWRPANGQVRGVLIVQHGLNDHGDRYAHLAETLVARGYAVYAMDLRGHGRSAGPRVEVDHFQDYLDDEATWISRVRDKEPDKPIFLFGHSMGGLIMTLHAEEHANGVGGVVLSAPALGIDAPPLQAAAIQYIGHLGSPGHMLPQRDAEFTRDPAVVRAMGVDPLLTHADGPTHTAVELVGGIERAWAGADRLTVPLIVLHGSDDRLTSPAATRDFVAKAASADKRHVLIERGWHDLAHDPARGEFEGDIAAWLDAHVAVAASDAATPNSVTRGGAALPPPAAEPATLRGDHAPSAMAVDAGAAIGVSSGAPTSGNLSVRYSRGGRAFAWHGELTLRGHDGAGLDVLPAGLATRLGRAGEVSLASGISVGWPGTWSDLAIPARLAFELPVGPAHLFGHVTASWVAKGPVPATRTLGADAIDAMLAVRLGGDHDYWSRVSAGSGYFLGATYARSGGVDVWGVVIGIHLWGVD